MAHVNVTIAGRTYRMACEDGEEERLDALARSFDEVIDELRRNVGEIGDQRLTVMAGLLVADRLDEARRRVGELERELRTARAEAIAGARPASGAEPDLAGKLAAAAARIDELTHQLNAFVRQSETR